MFMKDKAIIIIIVMYSTSFSLIAAQYVIGDVYGIALTSPVTGQQLRSTILDPTRNIISQSSINTIQSNSTTVSRTSIVTDLLHAAGNNIYELLQLLSGTYIFNLLYLLGVPSVFIAGLVVIAGFLIMISIVVLLRGNF